MCGVATKGAATLRNPRRDSYLTPGIRTISGISPRKGQLAAHPDLPISSRISNCFGDFNRMCKDACIFFLRIRQESCILVTTKRSGERGLDLDGILISWRRKRPLQHRCSGSACCPPFWLCASTWVRLPTALFQGTGVNAPTFRPCRFGPPPQLWGPLGRAFMR